MKSLLVVAVCVIILSLSLIIGFYRKRQLHTMNDQESVPENEQEPVSDLKTFQEIDLDNFDSLAPWERNAHISINQQILSIKNENYQQ